MKASEIKTHTDLTEWRERHTLATGKKLTKASMAKLMGVSIDAIQAWEQPPHYASSRRIPGWLPKFLTLVEEINYGGNQLTEYPPVDAKGKPCT